jgi:hypothetical protein
MKKLSLILLTFIGLVGCSSLELGDALSSEQYTQKILDLGLTHEENLIEASKLKTPHLVSVVSLLLTNARDEKIQYAIDLQESEKFAQQVIILNESKRFIGAEVTESIKTGVLDVDFDKQSYFLEGFKDQISDDIQHKLKIAITHNSKNKRDYISANSCDQWGRCDDIKEDGSNNKLELTALTSNASNCSAYTCNYSETLEIKLSDDFLMASASLEKDLNIRLISKKKNHKIKISKSYLMGYMKIAQ